jgi:hypothetical protein
MFLQLLMPTWRFVKCMRWEDDDDAITCVHEIWWKEHYEMFVYTKEFVSDYVTHLRLWDQSMCLVVFYLTTFLPRAPAIKFEFSTQPHIVLWTVTVCPTFFLWTQYPWVSISSVGKCLFFFLFYLNVVPLVGRKGWLSPWRGVRARSTASLFWLPARDRYEIPVG